MNLICRPLGIFSQRSIKRALVLGMLLSTGALASTPDCFRSCVANGGTSDSDRRPQPAPPPANANRPSLDASTLALIDFLPNLVQEPGSFVERGRGCMPGVAIEIYRDGERYWAKITDRVLVRQSMDPTRLPYCFYEIENRFPDYIPLFQTRDIADPFCQEFRGYRGRRLILRIRDRNYQPEICGVEASLVRNVEVGGYRYRGEHGLVSAQNPYPPEDATGRMIEISGWTYYQSTWPNQGIEYLGDFNNRHIEAVIDLDRFRARKPFNSYLNAYYGQIKPSVRGYERNNPVYFDGDASSQAVPYLYITNMRIPHRDYVEGF